MDQATELRKMVNRASARTKHARKHSMYGAGSSEVGPKAFAITSGKGGVGKTVAAVNLAIAFQRMGKKVLILDADLGLPNIDMFFDLNSAHNIAEVIEGRKSLADVIAIGMEGVAIIPASSGTLELVNLSEGQKINLLAEFDTLNNQFDILLIDTGAGISSNTLYFNLAAQQRIIIATPEPTSIADTYALMKVMFDQYGTENFILVVNMVKDEKQARVVYQRLSDKVAQSVSPIFVDYAGFIPWDTAIQESVTLKSPALCCYPESSSSKSFMDIAHRLSHLADNNLNDGNIKFFWTRLMAGEKEHAL
jgi:flagellar biosynthesis protein FlhG